MNLNRSTLLDILDIAITDNGLQWLTRYRKFGEYFKAPEARDYIMPEPPPLDVKGHSFALAQLEKLIKAIHERENGALEYLLSQTLANAEYLAGRSAGKKTYRRIKEIRDEQKQKANRRKTLQYIKDEDAYHLATCDLLLRAGAGFFKVEAIDEKTKEKITHKIVLRRQHPRGLGREEIPVREALAKLLQPIAKETIEKKLQEYNRLKRGLALFDKYDRDDKAFTKKLRKFFFDFCKDAGIAEFVFVQEEVTPSPQGILMYLLENLHGEATKRSLLFISDDPDENADHLLAAYLLEQADTKKTDLQ